MTVALPTHAGTGGDARLDTCVDRAGAAAGALRELDQRAVDRIVWEMVVAGLGHAIDLAWARYLLLVQRVHRWRRSTARTRRRR